MYFGEKFVGIVGMDFDYMSLANTVSEIEIYENGFACLELDGSVISEGQSEEKVNVDSQEYMRVSEKLVNGMTLVLCASYDDIRQIRYDIGFEIVCTVLILSVLFTVVAVIVVRRITNPLKNLTDAAEKLSQGDYNVNITESGSYEIRLLNTAFEKMVLRLKEREESLRLSANRDSITGLRNTTSYATWTARFDKKIENEQIDFGVVVFDLNDLKKTNDTYGHAVGDKLIITAAKLISDVFKRSPVFRIGGDEFLVVLQNKDLENHDELFELLISTCANTFVDENKQIPIKIAFGFSRFESGKDLKFTDVFKRADKAMYENKRIMKMHSQRLVIL
jgi:diguanylate cyclase (GGDEF)-like protein